MILDTLYEKEIEKYEQEDMQEYTDKEVQKMRNYNRMIILIIIF